MRCVLWSPRGGADGGVRGGAPGALIDELNRKGIAHEVVVHAYAALGRVCAGGFGGGGAGGGGEIRVLVFVEPAKLGWSGPMFRSFLGALDRYAPEVARWVYEPGASVALRALTPEDVERMCGPVARGMMPRMERRPSMGGGNGLRLVDASAPGGPVHDEAASEGRAGGGTGGQGDEHSVGEDVSIRAGQLTEEELSMLLGDGLSEPREGSAGGPEGGGKGKGFRIFGRGGREGPGREPGGE